MARLNFNKETGATLVVALIILLVMTMVGVSAMRSTTLQERMAANSRQYQLARNAAEHALRTAEEWMTTNIDSTAQFSQFVSGSTGLYSAFRLPGTTGVNQFTNDLSDDSSWANIGVEVTTGLSNKTKTQNPKYIIEYIGRGNLSNSGRSVQDLGEPSTEGNAPFFFRITAIGYGRNSDIYAVLESTYRTGSSEYFTY